MSHESGGGGGEPMFYAEIKKASEGVLSFLANFLTWFVSTILGTDKSHH